jgi:hypothetical protein
LIDDTYASEIGIIGIAFSVCDFIYQISSDPDWHREHHDEVVRRIEEYENSSKREVAVIRQMAEDVGIHLLDITEYEEILNNEGSANPNVMVIGEITNVNVTGPGNIVNVAKFMANVVNHVNQKVEQSGASDQVQQLVKQLTEQVNAISAQIPPEKATQMGNDLKTLSDEMALPQPRRKWYELSLDGIKEAAAALGGIGKPVVETVKMLLPLLVP